MTKPKIIQLNNGYIQNQRQKERYEAEETKKRRRFLGFGMVLIVLLFILPTYNMVASYLKLNEKKVEITKLQQELSLLKQEARDQKKLVERLQHDEYVEKYARAKYYYSFEGEVVYLLPDLLPK